MNAELLGNTHKRVDIQMAAHLAETAASGQPENTYRASQSRTMGNVSITPKYDPVTWSDLLNKSTRLRVAVTTMARNTVGLGYDVVLDNPAAHGNELSLALREQEFAERKLAEPNERLESFSSILEQFKIDMETTGDGWLEVTSDRLGRAAGIYHAPSRVMRYASDGRTIVLVRQQRTTHFRMFGDSRVIDPATGKESAGLPWDEQATTVLHQRIYAPDDEWYGAPRYVPAALAVGSGVSARMWNAGFLANAVLPTNAVVVENGNLSPQSREQIQAFISQRRGADAAGLWLLLEPNLQGISPAARETVRIRLENMGSAAVDGAFAALTAKADEEVREAIGAPKIMLGAFDDTNKASATIALRIAVQQELEPEISRIEYFVTRGILRAMRLRRVRLRLRRPRILDPLQEASLVQKLMTCLSVNDMRRVLSDLRGKPMPALEHNLADRPLAFLKDASMTQMAEMLAGDVAAAAAAAAAAPGEVTTVETGDTVPVERGKP